MMWVLDEEGQEEVRGRIGLPLVWDSVVVLQEDVEAMNRLELKAWERKHGVLDAGKRERGW